MTEPDVALTDYAVALECALFFALLLHGRARPGTLRPGFMLFYASMGAASVFGGTVHGFFLDGQPLGHAILWSMTLLAMGVTTFSIWAIGAALVFSNRVVPLVLVAAGIQLGLYCIAILILTQRFWVGIVESLPAVLFLLLAILLTYRREKHKNLLLAAGGLTLFLAAAVLQHLRVGVHPEYFTHNALYHVLQAVALGLFFQGGRRLVAAAGFQPGEKRPEVEASDWPASNGKPSEAFSGE